MNWHPILDHLLVTGSFDNIVRVHDIKKGTVVALKHHTDRVRSVCWNHELPWMLVSAGDD